MPVNKQIQEAMEEATRLTREGRLAEATAAIQSALGGTKPPQPPGDPKPSRTGGSLPRVPRAPRHFRSKKWMPSRTAGPAPDVSAGGSFAGRTYTNRAGSRGYRLYVPDGYVGQEVALVVMLHGCTQSPEDFAAGTRMNTLAEERTFLVAYPEQDAGANGSRCWNWFRDADQRRGRGEPSIISGITCEVLGNYNVAPGRVYVAGMSAGGARAAILGAAYPDLYAAVGVHSGLAPGAARDLPSALSAMRQGNSVAAPSSGAGGMPPLIAFHGDRDRTVHPRNAEHLLARCLPATEPETPVAVKQGQVPGGYAYTRLAHRDRGGRTLAERWTVHGLGHAWSGGSPGGSYTDPKGPDASAEMVRFFEEHPGRGIPAGG